MQFARKLWCRLGSFLGISRHTPVRAYIPPWSGFRCEICGSTAETEGELLRVSEPDFVNVVDRERKEKSK